MASSASSTAAATALGLCRGAGVYDYGERAVLGGQFVVVLDGVVHADEAGLEEVFAHAGGEHLQVRHVAALGLQPGAYLLEGVAEHGVEVEVPILALLQEHAAVIPAQQPLGRHEGLGAVADLAVARPPPRGS